LTGGASGKPGIILDRDGTLIDMLRDEETGAFYAAFHPSHLKVLPGVPEGLRALARAGYTLCIATNQPGAAKGQVSRGAIERTHQALVSLLEAEGVTIASVEVCFHHPDGGPGGDLSLVGACSCRKPEPGLIHAAIEHAGLDPARTWMVGDSPQDMGAARAAGVRAGLVFPWNRCELCPLKGGPKISPDLSALRLDELARLIVAADARPQS
jgi:D-glycero-D-manno-heptose 1,7-bisphosphate phosphatase